jgi:hypothetical protein
MVDEEPVKKTPRKDLSCCRYTARAPVNIAVIKYCEYAVSIESNMRVEIAKELMKNSTLFDPKC